MRTLKTLCLILLATALTAPVHARVYDDAAVDVEIVTPRGRPFRQFPLYEDSTHDVTRAYLEAVPGKPYAVRVTNRTGERVGLVVAVDGRNIISGKKSRLKRKEKMYVLGPYETATYRGWRTGRDRVNEFYFTSELDSYAGAFDDFSAMGVVAVAAFRDRHAPPRTSICTAMNAATTATRAHRRRGPRVTADVRPRPRRAPASATNATRPAAGSASRPSAGHLPGLSSSTSGTRPCARWASPAAATPGTRATTASGRARPIASAAMHRTHRVTGIGITVTTT